MMEAETVRRFPFKADQQGLEFVNPGECSLTHETVSIDLAVKMSFAATLHKLSVAFIFCNIGDQPMIPEQLPCRTGIKTAIGIEEGTFIIQLIPLHVSNQVLEFLFQIIAVIMIARNNPSCRDDRAIAVGYWQDIAGFGLLSPLVGDRFAPFFAALWLPSRWISDKFNSPLTVTILASKSRCKLPSLLHLRK